MPGVDRNAAMLLSNIDTAVFHNNSPFIMPGAQEARRDSRKKRGRGREDNEVGFMQPSIVSEVVCMVSKQMHPWRDHRPGARQELL